MHRFFVHCILSFVFFKYQFCVAVLVQMNVLWSQVSVGNASAMQVRECLHHTGRVEMGRGIIKRPPETPTGTDEAIDRKQYLTFRASALLPQTSKQT